MTLAPDTSPDIRRADAAARDQTANMLRNLLGRRLGRPSVDALAEALSIAAANLRNASGHRISSPIDLGQAEQMARMLVDAGILER